MKARAVRATVAVLMMAIGALPWVVTAGEETIPIPISPVPGEVGVYFADNMVFTPQWRTGNFVRIEVMVINMDGLEDDNQDGVLDPMDIRAADIDMYEQAEILADPSLIFNTRMVSVSAIIVQVVDSSGNVVWDAYAVWNPDGSVADTDGDIGREVNKAGHLIYGGQWDTTGVAPGEYTVVVMLPEEYKVTYAIATYKIGQETLYDPAHPYIEMADEETDWQYVEYEIGIGDVDVNGDAYVILGPVIGRGTSSGGGNGKGGQ